MHRITSKPLGMATHRLMKSIATLSILSAAFLLCSCAGIDSGNVQRTPTVRLTPNPPSIIVEPFSNEHASYLVKLSGADLEHYKKELTTSFQDVVIERLQKIAAAKKSWTHDSLPDHGWLIRGEFIRVYAGSGILRNAVGFGAGQSIFTTRVYVYDLSVSSTNYVLSFDTGISDSQKGSGSSTPGFAPAGGAAGAISKGIDGTTGMALMTGGATAGAAAAYSEGSTRPFPNPTQANEIPVVNENQFTSQYQDMARTARQIRNVLMYYSGTPMSDADRLAVAKTSLR